MITDFHSHVLPDVDDGSRSVQQSLAMLSKMAQQGISRVVATPHFYLHHEDPDRFFRRRKQSYEALLPHLSADSTLPELILGAEVYYFTGISESELIPKLTIGNSRCVMVEMPLGRWTEGMLRELEAMEANLGITPVIAHIDRYIFGLENRHLPEILEGLPVYVQANAAPFLSWKSRQRMLSLLKKGQIQLLGSDCHDLSQRPPNLSEAVDIIVKYLGKDAVLQIRDFENLLL